jgi:hypothetical protein
LLYAIQTRDARWIERLVARNPALKGAADRDGTPLAEHARASSEPAIARMFEREVSPLATAIRAAEESRRWR